MGFAKQGCGRFMLKHFVKYQSLGNDFILYDWYKKPAVFVQQALRDAGWPQLVAELCDRRVGVGADGVLILKSSPETNLPEMLIFNADGSQAQMCMNGVRAAAHYLFTHHGTQKVFYIRVGQRDIACSISEHKVTGAPLEIETNVGASVYYEKKRLSFDTGAAGIVDFEGHVTSVGNPHFVIFQSVEQSWLVEHGKKIEGHTYFPERTNVEFVWHAPELPLAHGVSKAYRLLVYERGCGMTWACSSGVAATLGTLVRLGNVIEGELIAFHMLGGVVIGSVDAHMNITLRASATLVYSGVLEHKE